MFPRYTLFFKLILTSLLVMAISPTVMAQDLQNTGQGDEWQHSLALYGWGLDIGGRTARGHDLDLHFHDIWDNLSFGFAAAYQARKGKWSVLADMLYLDLSAKKTLNLTPPTPIREFDRTTDVKARLEPFVFQLTGGYNLYQNEGTVTDFIFGTRYLNISTDLDLTFHLDALDLDYEVSLHESGDHLDAIIGLKGVIGLSDRWFLSYYADVGAGNSDLTWQVFGGVGFKAADWADISLVYRVIEWKLDGDVIDSLNTSGPAFGAIFRF